MPSSVWVALLLVVASTWILVRVLRKPAARTSGPATGGLYSPPAAAATKPAEGMEVTEMDTRGFLRITDDGGVREEPLPDSPLGQGEFPMAVWVAPDHTVYVVGKEYTGGSLPDNGVAWRRAPDGAWSTVFRVPGRVFGWVTGRSADEVVIGGIGGIFCFDGVAWREVQLPYPMMWKAWLDFGDDEEGDEDEDGEIVAQAFDDSVAVVVERGETKPCPPRPEPDFDRCSAAVDGVRYRVHDRSVEVGKRTLSPAEEAEIRGEMVQVQQILKSREAAGKR